MAERVGVAPSALARYVADVDGRLRRLHVASVIERASWRNCGASERKQLADWLVARAVEHDDASLLFAQALAHLRAERIVRPGLHRLLREVAEARALADREVHWRLRPELDAQRCAQLDALVANDPALGMAPLTWLDKGAPSSSPEAIKAEVAKLAYLRELGADRIDLSTIPPERSRQLAAVGRRAKPKALRAMAPERRHPVLLATLAGAYASITDEVVQMFDQALASTSSRARSVLADRRAADAEANLGRLELLDEILEVALDEGLDDTGVGAGVRGLGHNRLASAVRGEDERVPRDGGHLAIVEARYSHIRSFAPQALSALRLRASAPSEALDAARLLQAMNAEGRRHVPADALTGFVPDRWQPYLTAARAAGDESAYRHYWELAALFALQGALRSGEVWVEGSRRYGDVASYLIPPEEWPAMRDEVLQLCDLAPSFPERLARMDADYERYLDDLEALLADGNGPVYLDDAGELQLRPLAAETVAPDQGVTTYTHVSDQHSTYGTQVIVSTDRDGLYVLDEILGNTTELPILEHATDTHGQLLATFALFDLVGLKLSPRIAKIADKPRWRPHPPSHYSRWPLAGPLLAERAQTDVIEEQWDELCRVAGSLKLGYVSASLLVARLQASARQHPLAKALLEYGKLLRTLHALRWFTDEAFRRRIGRQLNKGESLNDLRRFIAYADAGKEKYRRHEDQTAQAHCLMLVVNICILSTTWYIQDSAEALRAEGREVTDEVIAHTSPGHFGALNPYGTHPIDVAAVLGRGRRRPLRPARP